MRLSKYFSTLFVVACVAQFGLLPAQAAGSHASGGRTYFVGPGVRSEFHFDEKHVQCKVAHADLPGGITFQMFMFSNKIDSVTIDTTAKTAVITGTMVSIVDLRFPGGSSVTLSETVPFTALAQDNATPGAGADFFSLTAVYTDTPGFDQFDLFGSPATFSGTLESGDIVVH